MTCRSAFLGLAMAALLPVAGNAQTAAPSSAPFTVPAADVAASYCVYGSMLYSIGAVIGVGEGGPPMAVRCAENRQWQPLAVAPSGPPPRR